MQTCGEIEKFEGSTANDLVEYTLDLQEQYTECNLRHDALSKWAMK